MKLLDLSLGYGDRLVIDSVTLDIPIGCLTAVVGPNGSGKSTLLRGMSQLLRPRAGSVILDGSDIATLSRGALARRLGLLPQAPLAPGGLTVAELVARGRYPHRSWYQRWSSADEAAVDRAIAQVGVADRIHDPVARLSGGQRQRAWLAMVLAQDTPSLLLDEPTTHLDLGHAVDVILLARSIAHDLGRTVVCVLHDLTLAARFADWLIVLAAGRVVSAGRPREVLTEQLIGDVFGMRSRIVDVDGSPAVVPIGRPNASTGPHDAGTG